MTFGLIDIILVAAIIISVLFALYRGLVRELLGITAWILAGFAALYSSLLKPVTTKIISNETTAAIVGAAVAALVVLVIMTLINAWIAKRLRQSALSGLDRVLGIAFGIARAALLAAVCYLGYSMLMPEKKLNELEEQNFSVPYVRQMAGWLEYVIPDNVMDDIKAYQQGKLQPEKQPKIGIELKQTVKEELTKYRESDKKSLDDMIDKLSEE